MTQQPEHVEPIRKTDATETHSADVHEAAKNELHFTVDQVAKLQQAKRNIDLQQQQKANEIPGTKTAREAYEKNPNSATRRILIAALERDIAEADTPDRRILSGIVGMGNLARTQAARFGIGETPVNPAVELKDLQNTEAIVKLDFDTRDKQLASFQKTLESQIQAGDAAAVSKTYRAMNAFRNRVEEYGDPAATKDFMQSFEKFERRMSTEADEMYPYVLKTLSDRIAAGNKMIALRENDIANLSRGILGRIRGGVARVTGTSRGMQIALEADQSHVTRMEAALKNLTDNRNRLSAPFGAISHCQRLAEIRAQLNVSTRVSYAVANSQLGANRV